MFAEKFAEAIAQLKRNPGIWTERGHGAYKIGITRKRVRSLARKMARQSNAA